MSNRRHFTSRCLLATCALVFLSAAATAAEPPRKTFRIAWSIYVGWMPWEYGAASGIVDKWAAKYGIDIDIVQVNDYVESINQYAAGQFDGVTATNMDTLTIPAAAGVASTALIVGDFSNGNDGVVLKEAKSLADIKGRNVNLVELSVSHYLLARALASTGLSERDIKVVNTSDADLVAAYAAADVNAVVTWNPLLATVAAVPGSTLVFDSSRIPGEIIDLTVVNSETLAAYPQLGKALVGAWYEIMARMHATDAKVRTAALTHMATASGTDLAGFESQLASTQMFATPEAALTFVRSDALMATMRSVAEFSFAHGLLGEGAPSAEFVGIRMPAGTYGDPNRIAFTFDDTFMAMAARGEL